MCTRKTKSLLPQRNPYQLAVYCSVCVPCGCCLFPFCWMPCVGVFVGMGEDAGGGGVGTGDGVGVTVGVSSSDLGWSIEEIMMIR